MEIRLLTPEDKPSAYKLASVAFSHGRRMDWADDPNQIDFAAYGVWDDAGLQAQVVILDYRMHMGPEVVLPMGGIAGVACMPASRGRGYVRAALIRALEHMKEAGQVVSALFPFSFDFYRQLGWEWIGVERRYTVPSRDLRAFGETANCRAAGPGDRGAIAEVYRQFACGYRGMVERNEKLWNRLLEDTNEYYTCTFLYEDAGRVEGYLTYRGGSGDCVDLNEFICLTPEARRGLLGLLRRMNMQTRRFAWSAPEDDGLWYDLSDHGVTVQIAPVTQARVVDVEGAVKAWKPLGAGRGRFAMRIDDSTAPWNDGTWDVSYEGGRATARKVRRRPELRMDIQAFTQLYMGSASAEVLMRNGRLQADDERGAKSASECFAGPIPWMNDHF